MFKSLISDATVLTQESSIDIMSMYDAFIKRQDYVVLKTGVAANVPPGHVLMICSRRKLAEKYQIVVMNAPAIVHPESEEEIVVILENRSYMDYQVREGDIIAQAVLVPIVIPNTYNFHKMREKNDN